MLSRQYRSGSVDTRRQTTRLYPAKTDRTVTSRRIPASGHSGLPSAGDSQDPTAMAHFVGQQQPLGNPAFQPTLRKYLTEFLLF
jgi:hypothetical protein